MAQDQVVGNTSSWSDLPLDIFYEILSFLPMLPFYFKLSRVNKAWSGIIEYLIERAGYVDARNMEISDLLHILNRCKGVKRVTLSNMRITDSNITHALENTNVETLVMSQCTFSSGPYHYGFSLNFFQDSKPLFEKLKSVVIFNSDPCTIWTGSAMKKYYLLENCENLNEISHGIEVQVHMDYQQFSQLYHVQFLLEVIKYAHETPSIKEDMNENNETYKNCLKICRRIDKCLKYYQTKSKSKEEIVVWTLFLVSGETFKSNKRKNNESSTTNKKRK